MPKFLKTQPLHLVNWIALFFAQSSEDSTAVAISSASNELHVNVSINKDTLQDVDRERAGAFLRCIYGALTQNAHQSGPTLHSANTYDNMISVLADNCWPMIRHRLEALKMAIGLVGVERLIEVWTQFRSHIPSEKSTHAETDDEVAVRRHLNALSTMSIPGTSAAQNGDMDTCLHSQREAMLACDGLLQHQFIPKPDNQDWFSALDYDTYQSFDGIHQHFRSIYTYHEDAAEFARTSIEYLRQIIGEEVLQSEKLFEQRVKVVWVRDIMGSSLKSNCIWELSPQQWLSKFLHDYEAHQSSICRPENDAHRANLLTRCERFWTRGKAMSTRIHPEVELLYYLEEKKLRPFGYAMGTDSDLCFVCGEFINQVNERVLTYWLTRAGSPNKVQDDWLLPPLAKTHPVGQYGWPWMSGLGIGGIIRVRAAYAIDKYLEAHRTKPKVKVDVQAILDGPPIDVDYRQIRSLSNVPEHERPKK